MKKEVLFIFSILFLNLIGAYGYGFSIGEIFDQIGSENFTLIIIFFASFALINWLLGRAIKDNRAMPAILGLCSALLITYGAYRQRINFDFSFLDFSSWSFSDFNFFDFDLASNVAGEVLFFVVPLLVVVFLICMLLKKKRYTFIITGILLIAISFTEFFYQRLTAFVIGLLFIVLGILFWILNLIRKHFKLKVKLK